MGAMNRIFFSMSFLLIMLSLVQATTLYGEAPEIKVTFHSQSPDPVEPGQVVTVKFKIENYGKETAQDVVVEILPSYPFTIYSGSAKQNIGKLRHVTSGDAIIVEYQLKVDEEAVEGDTELELRVWVGEEGSRSYVDNEFLIDIQTHDAVLEVTSMTFTPEQVAPWRDNKCHYHG
jgi:hypothetical protein